MLRSIRNWLRPYLNPVTPERALLEAIYKVMHKAGDYYWNAQELSSEVKKLKRQLKASYEDFDLDKEMQKALRRAGVNFKVPPRISRLIIEENVVAVNVSILNPQCTGFGQAICSPKDTFNVARGIKIALHRAVQDLQAGLLIETSEEHVLEKDTPLMVTDFTWSVPQQEPLFYDEHLRYKN